MGTISLLLELLYINSLKMNYINTIVTFIPSIIYLLYFIKNNKEHNKYLSYIIFTISSILLCINTNIDISFGLSLTSILIIIIESFFNKLKTNNSYIYLIITSIISLLFLNTDITIPKFILIILLNLSLIYYNITNKKDNNIYFIPAISLINSIFLSNILIIDKLNIMIFIDILIISITTYLSYISKKINQFTIISIIYIICTIIFYDLSPYITCTILLMFSYIHYISKSKDIFKFLLYTSSLILLRTIFKDLELLSITVVNIGSYLIYAFLVIRTILSKHMIEYKFLEYFILTLINMIAIFSYNNEMDGILYCILLLGLVIIGYNNKYGPLFITCLIFILFNALILTREFWLSIPWWIYVLVTGIILVLFASRNENKTNETKSKLDELKNKLDL